MGGGGGVTGEDNAGFAGCGVHYIVKCVIQRAGESFAVRRRWRMVMGFETLW